jgi:hypothetical protein
VQKEDRNKKRLFDLIYGPIGLVIILAGNWYTKERMGPGLLRSLQLVLPTLALVIFGIQVYVTNSQPPGIRRLQRWTSLFGLISSSLGAIYLDRTPSIFIAGLGLTIMSILQMVAWQVIFNREP